MLNFKRPHAVSAPWPVAAAFVMLVVAACAGGSPTAAGPALTPPPPSPIVDSRPPATFVAGTSVPAAAAAADGPSAATRTSTPQTVTEPPKTSTRQPESPAVASATPASPPVDPTPTAAPQSTRAPASPAPLIELPRDEGYHDVPVEWWYFSGHLSAPDDAEYSFHFAGFNFTGVEGVVPLGLTARVMHLTLASPDQGSLVKGARARVGRGNVPDRGFSVAVGGWSMSGSDGEFQLTVGGQDEGLALQLESVKDVVFHDEDGLLDMGPGGESYYYTYPRLDVRGQVTAGGETREVSGQAWMDHQWGGIVSAKVGWDWFSVQLDGGDEAMVFSLWDYETREPVRRGGTFVGSDGSVTYLAEDDIDISATGEWTSPRTGIAYPSGWRLGIAPLGLDLDVRPTHPDAEFDVEEFNPLAYWEGQVSVGGVRNDEPVSGVGFVELVGYDRGDVFGSPPPPPGG